jgi:hypothetical protein
MVSPTSSSNSSSKANIPLFNPTFTSMNKPSEEPQVINDSIMVTQDDNQLDPNVTTLNEVYNKTVNQQEHYLINPHETKVEHVMKLQENCHTQNIPASTLPK